MKIGIDLDDTISQSMQQVIRFHNDIHHTNFNVKDIKHFNIWEILGQTREDRVKEVHEFHRSDYAKEAKPLPYSQEVLKKLKKNNELFIITARAYDIKKETEDWINKHFPNIFSGIYFTSQFAKDKTQTITKKKVCDDLDIDIFIEDDINNILECIGSNRKAFLIDYPWNQTDKLPPNVIRVKSWKEIDIIIGKRN
ncbi:MAG: hypothetical protein WC933_00235 [Candidatus Paceibacterota bacterium]|jgi:uncharacterized HAD superfamily protein